MKIGILTMNRIVNYGSFLQAYALREMLQELGYDVEFMDIGPEKRSYYNMYGNNPNYHKNMVKAWLHGLLGHKEISDIMRTEQHTWKYYHTMYHAFPEWWETYLGMKREDNLNCCYDAVVVGSDEVFNCTQESAWGTSMKWFGEGLQTERLFSYAASFGFTTWNKLELFGLTDIVKRNLQNFRALSVRDENSRHIVQLCGIESVNHLDPVLVYDYESMVHKDSKLENNLIVYTYPDRLKEQSVIQQIKSIAKKEGLKLVSIGSYYDWCENPILTPFEVLQYFRNAKYVVTDTFHGTVFSLKFGTPFATLVRDSNFQKLNDLLIRLDQREASIEEGGDLDAVLHRQMPVSQLRQTLLFERKRAISFLTDQLKP